MLLTLIHIIHLESTNTIVVTNIKYWETRGELPKSMPEIAGLNPRCTQGIRPKIYFTVKEVAGKGLVVGAWLFFNDSLQFNLWVYPPHPGNVEYPHCCNID